MSNLQQVIKKINQGGVGIIKTDTIFGLVSRALDKRAVNRIYEIKKRPTGKPFIILISKLDDLKTFGVELNSEDRKKLKKYWPGPVSIIFPCPDKHLTYLHRGKMSLAFRLPKKRSLLDIIRRTGPLVAPSANLSEADPVKSITEAKTTFSRKVDFYYGPKSQTKGKPSKILLWNGGKIKVLRS